MGPMKAIRMLLSCTALLLGSGAARADVVPSPPADCMEGTEGHTCHGGPYCSPKTCTQDAECGAGKVCQQMQLCVGGINCNGGWEPDAEPTLTQNVMGTCEGGAACDAPASCTPLSLCRPVGGTGSAGGGTAGGSSLGSDDTTVTGCDCRVGAASGGSAAGLAALLAGAALLAARRGGGAGAHRAPPSRRSRSRQRRA